MTRSGRIAAASAPAAGDTTPKRACARIATPSTTGCNPGFPQTDDHPVVNVTWNDAVAFCQWLSRKEGKTYRLPTEAEWEYACRAGTDTRYSNGDDPKQLAQVANVQDDAGREKFPHVQEIFVPKDGQLTSAVGGLAPNKLGLYDMHGNVWQWCADWYGEDYYAKSPVDDPAGPDSGAPRPPGWGLEQLPALCPRLVPQHQPAPQPLRQPRLSRHPRSLTGTLYFSGRTLYL